MAESWNDQARIAMVESLTERGTLAIEHSKWGWFTGDKVMLREHFYATKPPTLSAAGAVSYWVLRELVLLTTGHELSYLHNEDLIYPWVTLTTSVLAFALLLVYFYRALHLVELSPTARWWLFWSLAIGSLYAAYSTVFNNHTVAGAGVFIAFYYVLHYRLGGPVRWWEAGIAGFAVSLAGVNDLTGALPFVALFFVLLVIHDAPDVGLWPQGARQRGTAAALLAVSLMLAAGLMFSLGPKALALLLFGPLFVAFVAAVVLAVRHRHAGLFYLIGVLVPVLAHLFLNSRITGNWLPTYIQSDVYITTPPGYFGEVLSPEEAGLLFWARWKYIGTALWGIRGVFVYTPAILIGLIYAGWTMLSKGDRLKGEAIAVVLSVLAGWGWVLGSASPNFGGTSFGFRYALPATPLLLFFCYRAFLPTTSGWIRTVFCNAVMWGFFVGLIALPYPWGIFGPLPATQCSIVENLEYIALNALFSFPR
jgi:hypothetical protein